jgi:hypothetical protein
MLAGKYIQKLLKLNHNSISPKFNTKKSKAAQKEIQHLKTIQSDNPDLRNVRHIKLSIA